MSQTEKYTELRQNVTESWGFVDMCRVEEECDKVADTLRLGVEIIDDIDQNEELVEVLEGAVNCYGTRPDLYCNETYCFAF